VLALRHPREFAEVRLGGRKNAYSGTCKACAEQIKDQVKGTSPVEGPLNPGLRPVTPYPYGI
jgi:hypothetical protein